VGGFSFTDIRSNRTGFFICCYMVERLGYKLQDAVDEFALKRPPGIKHSFFVDELFVRYGMKMQRRNTIVGLQ
jgi:protein-tyrosine phosphatase